MDKEENRDAVAAGAVPVAAERMTAKELARGASTALSRVRWQKARIVITRNGNDECALVTMEDYHKLETMDAVKRALLNGDGKDG